MWPFTFRAVVQTQTDNEHGAPYRKQGKVEPEKKENKKMNLSTDTWGAISIVSTIIGAILLIPFLVNASMIGNYAGAPYVMVLSGLLTCASFGVTAWGLKGLSNARSK